MTNPRLTPDGAGRGCFMPCAGLWRPLCGVLGRGNIGTLPDTKTALRACKWPLRRFCVLVSPLPCWTRTQNSRLLAVGRRTSGGKLAGSIGTRADTLDGLEGTKNRPRKLPGQSIKKPAPVWGGWWLLSDVAISADVRAVLNAGVNDCLALIQRIGVYCDVIAVLVVGAGGVVDVGPPQIVSVDNISLVFCALHCVPSFLPLWGCSLY